MYVLMSNGSSMKEQILEYCRRDIKRFYEMSDSEIYDLLCNIYFCKDYEMLRECSFIIFKESRRMNV